MATSIQIPRYNDVPSELEDFIEDLETYFDAVSLSPTANDVQCAAQLKCQAGDKIRKMLKANKDVILKEAGESEYEYVKRVIRSKELPKSNPTFESYKFRKIVQLEGETFQRFVQRLESQVSRCEFVDRERQLKDQVVLGCLSENLRKVALREDPNLRRVIELGKTEEYANSRSQAITDKSSNSEVVVNNVSSNSKSKFSFRMGQKDASNNRRKPQTSNRKCYSCGKEFPHVNRPCPASGKKCSQCNNFGHFGDLCPSNRSFNRRPPAHANSLEEDDVEPPDGRGGDPEEEVVNAVNLCNDFVFNVNSMQKLKMSKSIMIDTNIPVNFIADTGASVDIIDFETFTRLKQVKHYPLLHTDTNIYSYGSTDPLPVKGMFAAKLSYNDLHVLTNVYVLEKYKCGNLLGRNSCMKLNVVKFDNDCDNKNNDNNFTNHISSVGKHGPSDGNGGGVVLTEKMVLDPAIIEILESFPDGIGKLKDYELHLQIDEDAKPITQRPRSVPLAQREFVSSQIKDLLEKDIIEEVHDTATTWLSPIHVVQREGKQRMTVDMRVANESISRIRKPIPVPEEVLAEINGSTVFSKIDLNSAYFQIPLDEMSRNITTFQTHTGIYRFKRLFFGVTSACEEFQGIISNLLSGIQGCKNIADDIIVFGKTKMDHDKALYNVLKRLCDAGLTINRDKSLFGVKSVDFFGFKISDEGTVPLIKDSLQRIEKPVDKGEVRSFIGMVNFISKYIPNFSTVLEPISRLLGKDTPFSWGPEQDKAFERIMCEVKNPRVLKHFDPNLHTDIITDASPVGLSGILLQQGQPVKFISRKLTSVERRYSQIEREALAVVWACEKLHFYLYGIKFTVKSDHAPLKILYAPTGKPCARILRWALRLLPYKFDIQHIPGISNPADYFSRKPTDEASEDDNQNIKDTEGFVNSVIIATTPNSISLQEILAESVKDKIFCELVARVNDNKWHLSPDLKPFENIKDELSVKNGIILRDNKMLIPRALRTRCMNLAHSTHLGIEKCKKFLRSKVWWPGLDSDITEMIKSCGTCLAINPEGQERLEPLKIKQIPQRPFSTVHIDLFGPLESGITILGIIDELSRWPDLYMLEKTQTKDVIEALDKTFCRFGNPETLVSDNGPQFVSWEFKNYLDNEGIHHHLVTPYYPEANSSIERFFRNLKKFVKVCSIDKKDLCRELNDFLRMYRNTPVRSTGFSPAEMILRYNTRCKLPVINNYPSISTQSMYKEARNRDLRYKDGMKEKADQDQKRFSYSHLKAGDLVLVKYGDKFPKKSQPLFDPYPFKVTKRSGNRVYLQRNGKALCRPLHFVKKVPESIRILGAPNAGSDLTLHDAPRTERNGDNLPDAQVAEPPNNNLRNRMDIAGFRQRVMSNPRPQQVSAGVPQVSPPQPAIPQVQNSSTRYTSSGRMSRPVVGTRLADQVGI